MSSNLSFKVLVGAAALALGGTAVANTGINLTNGDLFLNIVDTTNSTSFLFDTGISQASFTGTTSLSPFNLASDPNYTSFVANEGASDVLDYSVVSGTKTTATPAVGTVYFTSQLGISAVVGNQISNALTALNSFTTNANGVSSTTTNSAFVNSSSFFWGNASLEGAFATALTAQANGDNAPIGTAMAYYSEASSALRSTTTTATLATFAGTWDLSAAGLLSYTVGSSSVPLPAPLMLLLSGLGLTGLLGRRGKSSGAGPSATAA